jgi:hypothetical protein
VRSCDVDLRGAAAPVETIPMTTTWQPALQTARHRAPETCAVRVATPAQVARPGRHAAAEDLEPGGDGDLLDWLGFAVEAR